MSPPATLADFVDALAANGDDPPALIDRDRPVAAATLADGAAHVAGGLAALGVGRGDRVALWMPDAPAWLVAFLACARLGAIAVAVNTRFRAHELADIVGRAGCRVLVFWPGFRGIDFAGLLDAADPAAFSSLAAAVAYGEGEAAAAPRVHGRPVVRWDELAAHAPHPRDEGAPDAGCVIFTTSGTTSRPKFVLHDQRTVLRHARDVAAHVGYAPGATRALLVAPLCGVFGFTTATSALAGRTPLVMHPAFDPGVAVDAVRRHRVTHAWGSDEAIARMLDAASGSPVLPTVRAFGWAAFSPAQADLPQRAEARGLSVVGLYGMSEVHALCAIRDAAEPLPGRALGGGTLVAPDARVRARDPVGGALLPHGAAGEIELDVPSRMVGYWGDDAATRAVLTDDGFLRTGDLGYTTGERSFVYLARLGDSLRLGGFLVSPAEIEDVLLGHPSVAAAQVVGADTVAGTRAVAFVVARDGALVDEASVLDHCAARIARYKVPVRVVAIDAFPVTPGSNGTKIQKARLRELAREALGGAPAG